MSCSAFKSAIIEAWRDKVSSNLCCRKGFRGGPLLDVHGSLQLLTSSHVRERDKALLGSIMVGGVWNGFLLGRVRNQIVPCRFCGAPDGDGRLFWECTFPLLVEIRENPELHDLIRMDKGHWPRCLLWHGWLPRLSLVSMEPLLGLLMLLIVPVVWLSLRLAGILLVFLLRGVSLFDFDAVDAASLLPDHPNVWTDGSFVLDRVTGVSAAGAGFFAHQPASCWDHRCWGHVDPVCPVGSVQCCRDFFVVLGPFQSVQRAELWGVILALQSSGAVHLGVDNLGVVRHVGGLLDGRRCSVPFELVKDGDLLVLIERMLHLRGLDTAYFQGEGSC